MTAEIGILNRYGVALAADSAVTISGNGKEKILNSANKLFNLIKGKPVGFMVYGNGSFMGLPWEVVVDFYRKNFDNSLDYPTLEYICNDFINTLSQNTAFHDQGAQSKLIYEKMSSCLEIIITNTKDILSTRYPNIEVDQDTVLSVLGESIHTYHSDFSTSPYSKNFTEEDKDDIYSKCDNIVANLCERYINLCIPTDLFNTLKEICAFLMCKDIELDYSGVVIAGYGDDEFLPRLFHYKIEGIVNNKLKYNIVEVNVISQSDFDGGSMAEIVPFAQQEMVHSILTGMDPSLKKIIIDSISNKFENIAQAIQSDDSNLIEQFRNLLIEQLKQIQSEINNYQFNNFVSPILNMVAMLNKDELATMAENLVNITSFKRKFTTDTETVGGPIDVAVISKSEGFIWIKRKHYFNPELNHAYFNK